MTLKDSQKNLFEHSEVKIKLLKQYLDRYLSILSSSLYIGNIHIYDLFCGPGIYENGGEGSPVVILKSINDAYFSTQGKGLIRKFNCHFNDSEGIIIDRLKLIVAEKKLHHPDIGSLYFTKNEYRELIPHVIEQINLIKKSERAFVFIDPYGYKNIQVSDIQQLLKKDNSEVLLFLPTQFMFRFEKGGTPQALFNFINELTPENGWRTSINGLDFIENLKDAFRKKLGLGYFVDSFIISRDLNQFFCLFFFTSHILGYEKMLESKWKLDEEEGRGWHFKSEGDLFDSVEKKVNTQKFEQSLHNFLSTSLRTNGEIYQFTLHNGHLCSHANQILVQWQKKGEIDVIKQDGSLGRKGAFYLNYNEYKGNPAKIRIKVR